MFLNIVKLCFTSVLCWAREHGVDYSEFPNTALCPCLAQG